MIALTVAAPLLAALLTMAFRPLHIRRFARLVLAAVAAATPLVLIGRVDWLSAIFVTIVSLIGWLATAFSTGLFSFDWGRGPVVWARKPVYFLLLAAFWSAMLIVVTASNFALLWFGISATTLTTAFLVGFSGDTDALEAAWKYLVLCSVGIGFAFLGIVLLGRAALDAGLDPAHALAWGALASVVVPHSVPLARLAIAIMLIGFATKAGLVPMHAWLPDAHSKAPPPVSALLSGVLVSCALYAIIRTSSVAEALGAEDVVQRLLLYLGVASIVVAGGFMLVQRDLKRLLAYSTVEHAGIVALALGFGGPLGMFAALLHLVAHAFSKSSAFFAAGLVQSERGTTRLAGLHGSWRSGVAGKFLLAAMIALSGMPPFGLFVSELLVVAAGVAARQWTALGFGCAGMLLAFTALTRATIELEGGPRVRCERPSRLSIGAAAGALTCALVVALVPWLVGMR